MPALAMCHVYSLGVVLFEILSAKAAVVHTSVTGSSKALGAPRKEDQVGLTVLFEEVLKDPAGKSKLGRLIDPRLEGKYPLESAWNLAQLAGACTEEDPQLRPSMRTVVVALTTLSSARSHDWEMRAFGSDTVLEGVSAR
jgi:chitin elicitor receptor kinase 1